MSGYNGHKNWNHWNVSLWINNDEGLYRAARYCVRMASNRREAAENMLRELEKMGLSKTPDGAPYSATSIRAAMVGL